nr:serine protease gd-like [Leptinotarsa decemlineata]
MFGRTYKSLSLLFLVLTISTGQEQIEFVPSPCPRVFIYSYDQLKGLYGSVLVPGRHANAIYLDVELSVGNIVHGYNGHIEIAKSKSEIIQDILNNRPVLFKIFFPVWINIPPKITKILANGNLICFGPAVPFNLVPFISTIHLYYQLRLDDLPRPIPQSFRPNNIFSAESQPSSLDLKGSDSYDYGSKDPPNGYSGNGFTFQDKNHRDHPATEPPFRKNVFFNFHRRPEIHPIPETTSTHRNQPIETFEQSKVPYKLTSTQSPIDTANLVFQQNVYGDFKPQVPKNSINTSKSYQSICGKPITTNTLMINGKDVPRGAFPWLAAIFGVKPAGTYFLCGASLVSDRHVVTAAHCTMKENKILRTSELLVILGKLNIQKWIPSYGEKIIEPESIHIHPDYKDFSSDADIAILVLSGRVEFNEYIRPVCLWSSDSELEKIVGKQGTVVGWGRDENGDLMTAEPKQIQLPVVSQEACLRSSYQFQYITSNRTFCAGLRDGSGPCNGDSGSGFTMKQEERWMLRGLVSTSISDSHARTCDLTNFVVFTDASKFYYWILSIIK